LSYLAKILYIGLILGAPVIHMCDLKPKFTSENTRVRFEKTRMCKNGSTPVPSVLGIEEIKWANERLFFETGRRDVVPVAL
jgi:hypothetical protein